MTNLQLYKLYKDVGKGMFRFFANCAKDRETPVVILQLPVNIIDIFFEVVEKNQGKELRDLLDKPEHHIQLEASARIYSINKNHQLKSALFTKECLGSLISEDTLKETDQKVQAQILDYHPYDADGVIHSYKQDGKDVFPVSFMRYISPITKGRNEITTELDSIKDNVYNSIEYGLLEHIYEMKQEELTKNKRKRFVQQMESMHVLKDSQFNYNEAYRFAWNNPHIENFTIIGLMGGMRKVYGASNNLPHNAVTSFIELYNKAL